MLDFWVAGSGQAESQRAVFFLDLLDSNLIAMEDLDAAGSRRALQNNSKSPSVTTVVSSDKLSGVQRSPLQRKLTDHCCCN